MCLTFVSLSEDTLSQELLWPKAEPLFVIMIL
jgi:hypothetical protein